MKFDRLEFIARAATALTDAEGLRAGSASVVDNLLRLFGGKFAFLARLRRDGDIADIIASSGLGVADYRRLESRISKSSLWKMLQLAAPFAIDSLGEDTVLNFLSFGTGAVSLVAVPVIFRGKSVGLLAVGFPDRRDMSESETIKLLIPVATVLAQAMRVERVVAEESRKITDENTQLKQELRLKYDFRHLVGTSSVIRHIRDQADQVARSNAAVLIRGEGGTGKELIASAIHFNSLRSKRPFIRINCSARSESQVERELFGEDGHKKGAFEQADGGTLVLDEIGDLSLNTQARLLRAVRDREIDVPGAADSIRVNVRLITSSCKDIEDLIANGRFRDDLFYSLNMFTIFLPPLRERKSDILLLAEYFLEKYESVYQKRIRRISTPAIDMLTAYHFPGNVRELENVIERAVIVCDSNVIHGHHLPPTLQTAENSGTETNVSLTTAVEAFECDLIKDTLKSTRGNVAKAAKMLDSTERIIGYKIRKYNIDPHRFRK